MIVFEGLPVELRKHKEDLREWLHAVAGEYGSRITNLNYRFMNDKEIREANRIHLDHDYPTDIITFGYREGVLVEGDILIGSQTVADNSHRFGTHVKEELLRVMAHGLLHLIGYNDQSEEEKKEMRSQEEKCLILQPKNLRYK